MARRNPWKYHNHFKTKYELDKWRLEFDKTSTTSEARKHFIKTIDEVLGKIDLQIKQDKLEGVLIKGDHETEYGYDYNSEGTDVFYIIVEGYVPMTDSQIIKKDKADKKKRAATKLKKTQEKEAKTLKERLEYERLKRKYERSSAK